MHTWRELVDLKIAELWHVYNACLTPNGKKTIYSQIKDLKDWREDEC